MYLPNSINSPLQYFSLFSAKVVEIDATSFWIGISQLISYLPSLFLSNALLAKGTNSVRATSSLRTQLVPFFSRIVTKPVTRSDFSVNVPGAQRATKSLAQATSAAQALGATTAVVSVFVVVVDVQPETKNAVPMTKVINNAVFFIVFFIC